MGNFHSFCLKHTQQLSRVLALILPNCTSPTGCSCFLPLGMESGYLPDSALSASSSYDANHIPQFSRLNKIPAKGKVGAWCARSNNRHQWLKVFFGRETTITKVAIQGRYDAYRSQWVTSFRLSYSADGIHWAWYRLSDGQIKVQRTFLRSIFYMKNVYLYRYLVRNIWSKLDNKDKEKPSLQSFESSLRRENLVELINDNCNSCLICSS